MTGKTINQHIEGAIKKVTEPKKRVEEALALLEEILVETSDRKMRGCGELKGIRSEILSTIVDKSKGELEPDNKEGQEFVDALDKFAKEDKHRSEVLKDRLGSRVQAREEQKEKKKKADKTSEIDKKPE